MRSIMTILAATLLATTPAMAQVRSFCSGAVEVNAGYRGASDAQGNYIEYTASVSGTDPNRISLNVTVSFNAPMGVRAAPPTQVSLGAMGRARVVLGTERPQGTGLRPSIPRAEIANYVAVRCP